MSEDAKMGCGLLFALVAVIALLGALSGASCSAKWPDRETRWGLLSGCLVKTSAGWVPSENLRELPA